MKKTFKEYTNTDFADHFYVDSLLPKRKDPTKTFYGGVVIGILSTLAFIYILIPVFDWANDTLLTYFMK